MCLSAKNSHLVHRNVNERRGHSLEGGVSLPYQKKEVLFVATAQTSSHCRSRVGFMTCLEVKQYDVSELKRGVFPLLPEGGKDINAGASVFFV